VPKLEKLVLEGVFRNGSNFCKWSLICDCCSAENKIGADGASAIIAERLAQAQSGRPYQLINIRIGYSGKLNPRDKALASLPDAIREGLIRSVNACCLRMNMFELRHVSSRNGSRECPCKQGLSRVSSRLFGRRLMWS